MNHRIGQNELLLGQIERSRFWGEYFSFVVDFFPSWWYDIFEKQGHGAYTIVATDVKRWLTLNRRVLFEVNI